VRPPLCSVLLSLSLMFAGVPARRAAAAEPAVERETKIVVLPLRIDGQVDEAARTRWTEGLRGGLSRGSLTVVPDAEVRPYLEGSCDRQACYDKVRANTGATHIVRPTVVIKNRDYLLKLDLLEASTGKVLMSNEDRCEICGTEEVAGLLDSQGALLQTRLAAQGKGPAVLMLDTRPSGALVLVDGEVVGTTPLERPVLEGPHKIRVSLDGYVAEEREINFVNGVREEVSLPLQRTPGNPKTRALGAAGLAGGLVLVAGGITLVALDDREYPCKDAEMDAQGDCPDLFNTAVAGALMIGAGAILGTLGAVALHRHRGAKPGSKRAQVVPTGLGLRLRF
jgi:hypothetical protein